MNSLLADDYENNEQISSDDIPTDGDSKSQNDTHKNTEMMMDTVSSLHYEHANIIKFNEKTMIC